MIVKEVQDELFRLQDEKYRNFQAKLMPTIESDAVIGVRTPELRKYARQLVKRENISGFLNNLPYVDNWATCDQMSPKVFGKHRKGLLGHIRVWIQSDETYTVRFVIGMLMEHFLDEDFHAEYPEMVAKVRSDEYYVKMMIVWYFATALAKQYDATLPYIEKQRLDTWTHNKTIQKAVESYRITSEQKEYLKGLRVKKQHEASKRKRI